MAYYIQRNLGGGNADHGSCTHGTSAQREKWLTTGNRTGDPHARDTFAMTTSVEQRVPRSVRGYGTRPPRHSERRETE